MLYLVHDNLAKIPKVSEDWSTETDDKMDRDILSMKSKG